jgi:hypothetical protein
VHPHKHSLKVHPGIMPSIHSSHHNSHHSHHHLTCINNNLDYQHTNQQLMGHQAGHTQHNNNNNSLLGKLGNIATPPQPDIILIQGLLGSNSQHITTTTVSSFSEQ